MSTPRATTRPTRGYSARRLGNALQLDLTTQVRYYYLPIYMVLALGYVALFRFTPLSDYTVLLLPLFLFSEPGLLGFYLSAAQLFFERNEKSLTALSVTPLRTGEYLAARAVSNGVIATLAGATLFGLVFLAPVKLALLLPPLFLTATFFALTGLGFSVYFDDFIAFAFASALVQIPLALPYISYFNAAPEWLTAWVPSHPAIFSFANLASAQPNAVLYVAYLAELLLFNALAFWWAHRVFIRQVRNRLEAA